MNHRPASSPARTVDDYRATVAGLLAHLADRPAESVPVTGALGRVLADDVRSPIDLPVFRNSAMDGYAVRAADVTVTPVTLTVAGLVPAGNPGAAPVGPGQAVKVMTGAPIPPGADAVVPVEDVRRASDGHGAEAVAVAGRARGRDEGPLPRRGADPTPEDRIVVERGRDAGEFVREAGTDVRVGALVARRGTVLAPRHIAALAAVGLPTVPVVRRPRAMVITTGDELRPAGSALAPGQIFDSNGIALAAALEADGVTVVRVAHSVDDPAVFAALLREAVAAADVVFTSGGVSKGDFEVVKDVLAPLGGVFGPVAVQPGGPQGYTILDGVPVLSFPGNPVSTMVSYEVFARAALRELGGLPAPQIREAPLLGPIASSPAGRRQFLRGVVRGSGVEVVSGPGSHLIAGMAWAEVLVDVPAEVTSLPEGAPVRIWSL
ncbi:molybdopterin molybdotransferase MoeA [Nocardia thailandica]|uniref:molybdopterin molybdotransferase MoeA n=1 Tax=Nocardia thailandica TaxID=257275 RepID=UPI0002D84239|nr:gephyrin-like molybdotransferase Glp [Nocardia thailandica]